MNAFLNFMIILKDKSKSAFLKIFENQKSSKRGSILCWLDYSLLTLAGSLCVCHLVLICHILTFSEFLTKNDFYPQAPVAQKVADEVVFRRFQGEGVEFF